MVDLDQEIRTILDTTDITDVDQIILEILRPDRPNDEVLAIAKIALREYVRVRIKDDRHARMSTTLAPSRPHENSGRSRKVAGIRNSWQAFTHARVFLGGGKAKLLGDCTYDDLMTAIAIRDAQIKGLQATIEQFQRIATKVKQYGVETVKDLPAEAQNELLGGVAA